MTGTRVRGGLSANAPDRNLALELVRVTEAAALAASGWVGRGEKEKADQAAVDAMRLMLGTVEMNGVVVIGEGEKDEAPMLYNGEEIGSGHGPAVDVAVDPLEGTRLTALGQPNAIAVIAVAERGTMFDPGAAFYMDKIAVGREAAHAIDINASPTENVRAVAKAKGLDVTEVTVVVLERDRHNELIGELRQSGARVNLIRDGDVAPSIAAAQAFVGVDILMGIGGTPRASSPPPRSSACAVRSRASSGRATTTSVRSSSTPATTSTACSPPTTSCRATMSSSPRPASRAVSSCAACVSAAPASRPSRS